MAEVSVTARVEGIGEAVKRLTRLEQKARRRVVNAGVRAACKPALQAAKGLVPVRTGGLRASLRIGSVRLDRRTGTVTGTINAGEKSKRMAKKGLTAFYAHMVAGGTRPHVITARRARALKIGTGFARSVQHPGTKPDPFFEDAAERAFTAAVGKFREAFNAKMNEEIAKL